MDDHPPAARPAAPQTGAPQTGAPKTGAPQTGAPQTGAPKTGAIPAMPAGLAPGDRMPVLTPRTRANPQFKIDAVAGRWIVLGVIGSAAAPGMAGRVAAASAATLFDDAFASLFLITQDAGDADRLADRLPGVRSAFDDDAAIARALGALRPGNPATILPGWYVIDPGLTVQRIIPFRADGGDTADLLAHLGGLARPDRWLGYEAPTPILILPDVFEPAFCDRLIGL